MTSPTRRIVFEPAADGTIAKIRVGPGGVVDFEAGARLEVAGVDITSALSGVKFVGGESALDGTNPTSVAHGLDNCLGAFAMLKGSVAPGVGTSVITGVVNGANIDFYGWKPTSNANPTLVASTGTEGFYWIALGTVAPAAA